MVRFFLFISLSISSSFTFAQTLLGKVVDGNTQSPLSYAHLACPETGEGTITDANGNFKLIVKDVHKTKTLKASFVGYQTLTKIIDFSSSDHLTFTLLQDTTVLKELVITAPDPVALIQQAILKIPENHGGHRLLACFYRMATRNQQKYIQISEASFELNQSPENYNQVKVLKAREIEDEKAFNGVGMGIGTPVGAVRNLDFTMKPEESFLSPANLKKHDFFYEGITHRAGVEVHEISFDQKKVRDALYKGKLFIHTTSLAFVAVDYGLSPKGISHFHAGNAAERAMMKLLDIHIEISLANFAISYRQFGNKWYLDHIVRDENVNVKSKRFNFDVPVVDRSEILTTGIDTIFNHPFADGELTKQGFIESISDTTKSFWEDYNIIPSTTNYDAIAKEIELRNGNSAMKSAIKNKLKDLPKETSVRIDSILNYYHQKGSFNGTALIKQKGKVILHKGYGLADQEAKIKNDTATVFRIGSIAKTFTARIIWQLKQEGLLSYGDSVQRFVPWYPHHGITIHHLLTHSSGLPNFTNQASFIDSIAYPFTIEELIQKFGCEKPTFKPGAEFKYSNTGYTLLALVAEKASGKKFSTLFDESIATPLHLTRTYFDHRDNPGQAKGYWNGVIEPSYAIGNMAGAGAISSTAGDLLKWSEAHNNLLASELFFPHAWYADWGSHYGYGWNIDKYQFWTSKKHTIHYHGGTDFGFKSMLARQPDKDNVVILLNNTGEFPLFDITDLILNVLN